MQTAMEFKPEYYAVLEALSTGAKTVKEIAELVDMEPHDVEAVISALMGHGLVERREKGLLFKKEAYALTERGWEVLYMWREEVKGRVEKAAELRRAGRVKEAEEVLAPVESVLPLMLTLGLLDMALYAAALGQLATLDEAAELGVEAFDSGDFDVGDGEL
jgi:DNA-binding MarR family transcriptional regulator